MNKKRSYGAFTIPVSEMGRDERAAHINDNESIRAHIVERMERILVELSYETGNKRYKKRRYRLGKSPNDV